MTTTRLEHDSLGPVYLEMNVYKPLFRKFLVEGTKPNLKQIGHFVERSLMLVTSLSPVIGYDKASMPITPSITT
jgi:fumarate hydratase class II